MQHVDSDNHDEVRIAASKDDSDIRAECTGLRVNEANLVAEVADLRAECVGLRVNEQNLRTEAESLRAAAQAMLPQMKRRLMADERPTVDGMLCAVELVPGAMYADVWPARWNAEQGNFDAAAGWFEADEVIAWMPLPAAPSPEGDAS